MKYNINTLNNLPLNIEGKINSLGCNATIKRRLLDLGLTQNTFVIPVLESPSSGIRAYWFRNTLIAIRNEDSSSILINF